jgi:hypothetical protein
LTPKGSEFLRKAQKKEAATQPPSIIDNNQITTYSHHPPYPQTPQDAICLLKFQTNTLRQLEVIIVMAHY